MSRQSQPPNKRRPSTPPPLRTSWTHHHLLKVSNIQVWGLLHCCLYSDSWNVSSVVRSVDSTNARPSNFTTFVLQHDYALNKDFSGIENQMSFIFTWTSMCIIGIGEIVILILVIVIWVKVRNMKRQGGYSLRSAYAPIQLLHGNSHRETRVRKKHRKNCECCPRHSLFKF